MDIRCSCGRLYSFIDESEMPTEFTCKNPECGSIIITRPNRPTSYDAADLLRDLTEKIKQGPVVPPVEGANATKNKKWKLSLTLTGIAVAIVALVLSFDWLTRNFVTLVILGSAVALLLSVVVFGPMLIFRRSKAKGARGLFLASYVFGLDCWLGSLVIAFKTLGVVWMVVGLLLAGVGIVPMALIGSAIRGQWVLFWRVASLLALTLTLRLVGASLSGESETTD